LKVQDGWLVLGLPLYSNYREVILIFAIVFCGDYLFIQISCWFVANIAYAAIQIGLMPYTNRATNRIQVINEFAILINLYHGLCLTNFVIDPESRFKVATSLILFNCAIIGYNLIYILCTAMVDFYRKAVGKCKNKKQKVTLNKRKTQKPADKQITVTHLEPIKEVPE